VFRHVFSVLGRDIADRFAVIYERMNEQKNSEKNLDIPTVYEHRGGDCGEYVVAEAWLVRTPLQPPVKSTTCVNMIQILTLPFKEVRKKTRRATQHANNKNHARKEKAATASHWIRAV